MGAGAVLCTANGGAMWVMLSDELLTSGYWTAVTSVDPAHAWIIEGNGDVFAARDGLTFVWNSSTRPN